MTEDRAEPKDGNGSVETEKLEEASRTAQLEGRMVLPGIQTLFGFQLAVVFTEQFVGLSVILKSMHVASIALVVVSIAMVIAPAAYHRQIEPGQISKRFLAIINWFLTWSLVPLLLALSIELFVLIDFVFSSTTVATVFGLGALAIFVGLWFVFPRLVKRIPKSGTEAHAAHPGVEQSRELRTSS
jgi:hypothetical protein